MANIKKFDKPINVTFRMEESIKKSIDSVAVNKNDWLNQAVAEKLAKEAVKEEAK